VIALLLNQSSSLRVNTLKDYNATPEEVEAYGKLKADAYRAALEKAEGLNYGEADALSTAILKGD
jgi:hypothetical protein